MCTNFIAKDKCICDYSGDPSNGFTLLGASGCGKSTSIMLMLEQFPQLILHENKVFGRFLQIVYLKVNCLPNSNISALLDNIGTEIDKALQFIITDELLVTLPNELSAIFMCYRLQRTITE